MVDVCPQLAQAMIVMKTPAQSHKDHVHLSKCKIRVCGDYCRVNSQISKIVPNLPTGLDEVERAAGHRSMKRRGHIVRQLRSCEAEVTEITSTIGLDGQIQKSICTWTLLSIFVFVVLLS